MCTYRFLSYFIDEMGVHGDFLCVVVAFDDANLAEYEVRLC